MKEREKVLREAAQWVPVEERLPIRPGVYYVTFPNGRVGTSAFYVGAFDRGITAWMPLPEPYEAALEAAKGE